MGKLKIILVCALISLAFAGGAIYQYYGRDKPIMDKYFDYSANLVEIDVEQAILWLDRAAYSHQHNLLDGDTDNDEFHQGCIDRYASIKKLLLELKSGVKGVEIIKMVETVVYRYPNTPPYEAFSDPIDFDQALVLLYGFRTSHVQALNWEFESDPGFGIADKDLQEQFIKWYDQLIDIFWRMEGGLKDGF